jgi:hypothetical protein
VRDDDEDGDRGPGDGEPRDRRPGQPAAAGERVPEPEAGDRERHVLLRERRQHGEEGERQQAIAVEVPEGEEQEGGGERDRVEVAQRHPLDRRVEEVREGEAERGALGAQVAAREPEDGQGTERHEARLDREQHARPRPDPPEGREQDEDRVDVRAETDDLVAAEIGDRERAAMGRRPDRLHHVPEVEAPGRERPVPEDGERREPAGVGRDRSPECGPGAHLPVTPSSRPRQRAPRTASLARCS